MMINIQERDPRWIVKVRNDLHSNSPRDAKENDIRFLLVGNKLINNEFIEGLLKFVDGKIVASPFVIDVSDLSMTSL